MPKQTMCNQSGIQKDPTGNACQMFARWSQIREAPIGNSMGNPMEQHGKSRRIQHDTHEESVRNSKAVHSLNLCQKTKRPLPRNGLRHLRNNQQSPNVMPVTSETTGPVAQWIRHRPTEPGIAGSSAAGVIGGSEAAREDCWLVQARLKLQSAASYHWANVF